MWYPKTWCTGIFEVVDYESNLKILTDATKACGVFACQINKMIPSYFIFYLFLCFGLFLSSCVVGRHKKQSTLFFRFLKNYFRQYYQNFE